MIPVSGAHGVVRYIVTIGLVLVLAGGCGSGDSGDDPAGQDSSGAATSEATSTEEASTGEAAGGPVVTVSADKTHAVQPGDELTVTVSVKGLTLDPEKIGASNEPGVGHYRVYLDEAAGDEFLAESAAETVKVTVPDSITDGSHQLRVVLHNNDGTPVEPPAQGDVWLIVYRL